MDPRVRQIRQQEIQFKEGFDGLRYKFRMRIGWIIVPIIVIAVIILSLISGIKAQAKAEALAAGVPVVVTTEAPVVAPVVIATEEAVVCPSAALDSVREWCSLVNTEAKEYGLDPILVLAVMTQESGGQSDILSENGAVGLMQIMPKDGYSATFECANGPCFAGRPSTKELLDPEFNVDYGCRMLSGLINKYGSERDALKAYGPLIEDNINTEYDESYIFADKVLAIKERISQ